ncbi:hypothetical protein Landi51_07489 [Colletotrichum acutatum]
MDVIVLSYLDTPASTGKLTNSNSEKEIWAQKSYHREVDFVKDTMVPLVFGRESVRMGRDPDAKDDRQQARPENVDAPPISSSGDPSMDAGGDIAVVDSIALYQGAEDTYAWFTHYSKLLKYPNDWDK